MTAPTRRRAPDLLEAKIPGAIIGVIRNGETVVKGYGEIARQWLVRPVFVPIHPPSLAAERMGAGQRGS